MSRYHELNGSHSNGIPSMRNLPLFIFLTALVFFFYVFYIYQAQGTELSLTKEQLEVTSRQLRQTKEELIDTKAAFERAKEAEGAYKNAKEVLTKKNEDCQSSLRTIRLQSEAVNSDRDRLDTDAKEKVKRITELDLEVNDLRRNNSALQTLAETQGALVVQLNQTIQLLQKEINGLKKIEPAQGQSPVRDEDANRPSLVEGHHETEEAKQAKAPSNARETLTENGAGELNPRPAEIPAAGQQNDAVPAAPNEQQAAGVLEAPKNEDGIENRHVNEQQAEELEEREMVRDEEMARQPVADVNHHLGKNQR